MSKVVTFTRSLAARRAGLKVLKRSKKLDSTAKAKKAVESVFSFLKSFAKKYNNSGFLKSFGAKELASLTKFINSASDIVEESSKEPLKEKSQVLMKKSKLEKESPVNFISFDKLKIRLKDEIAKAVTQKKASSRLRKVWAKAQKKSVLDIAKFILDRYEFKASYPANLSGKGKENFIKAVAYQILAKEAENQ